MEKGKEKQPALFIHSWFKINSVQHGLKRKLLQNCLKMWVETQICDAVAQPFIYTSSYKPIVGGLCGLCGPRSAALCYEAVLSSSYCVCSARETGQTVRGVDLWPTVTPKFDVQIWHQKGLHCVLVVPRGEEGLLDCIIGQCLFFYYCRWHQIPNQILKINVYNQFENWGCKLLKSTIVIL